MAAGSAELPADRLEPHVQSTPLKPIERIEALDALRGLALFGVLAINVVTEFRVSLFELPTPGDSSPFDRIVEILLLLAVQARAVMLFSLLFGVGLAIQFERLADNSRRTLLLIRRLTILLAFGLAHVFLIWNGDILAEYAVAGLVVLPFLFGPRWLLAASALGFFALYMLKPLLPPLVDFPDASWIAQHAAETKLIYGAGGFWDLLAFRIREAPFLLPLHVAIFPRTVALFLFGALLWRSGILKHVSTVKHLLFAVPAIIAGGALIVAEDDIVEPAGALLMALGYGAAVLGLMNLRLGRKLLAWAAPVGRMAFTNYFVQSVIFGWIFYGYGLGLFGRVGTASAFGIGILVYAAQVMFSAYWLKYYWYGPVEWLWRRLMYGVPQPLRRRPSKS
jgi:uncharacterized protein